MQSYPRFLFHKTHAPEGQLFASAADEPTGDGWVETPAAFDPDYVPPPPEPENLPDDARRAGYVPQAFPCFRYNRHGDAKLVQNAAEADLLDSAEWQETPDPDAFPPETVSTKKGKRSAE